MDKKEVKLLLRETDARYGKIENTEKMKRHDYLFISPSGRLYAYGQAREYLENGGYSWLKSYENPDENEQFHYECETHFQELFLERHGKDIIPAIVRRQENVTENYLQVGWSSWKTYEDVRFRAAVEIPRSSVERVVTPYEVFENKDSWPDGLKLQLSSIHQLASQYGILVGLIGAAGMEALTGMPYLRDTSDVDLIVAKEPSDSTERFGSCLEKFYEEVCQIPGRRVDMELQLTGGWGVKLAEWVSDSRTILIKGDHGIRLAEKQEFTL